MDKYKEPAIEYVIQFLLSRQEVYQQWQVFCRKKRLRMVREYAKAHSFLCFKSFIFGLENRFYISLNDIKKGQGSNQMV